MNKIGAQAQVSSQIVAIAGGSGSGKSWLANKLQEAIGPEASRLSLDDFYMDLSHLSPAKREKINFDHPRAIDWNLVEKVLNDCRSGHAICIPRYDFKTHTRLSQNGSWYPKLLVLMDGLWLLSQPSIRYLFTLNIYIECPLLLRFHRRLQRDLEERRRTPTSVCRQFFNTVEPMHKRYVVPQKGWADLVLSHPPNQHHVKQLAEKLRDLLNNGGASQTR